MYAGRFFLRFFLFIFLLFESVFFFNAKVDEYSQAKLLAVLVKVKKSSDRRTNGPNEEIYPCLRFFCFRCIYYIKKTFLISISFFFQVYNLS